MMANTAIALPSHCTRIVYSSHESLLLYIHVHIVYYMCMFTVCIDMGSRQFIAIYVHVCEVSYTKHVCIPQGKRTGRICVGIRDVRGTSVIVPFHVAAVVSVVIGNIARWSEKEKE